MTHPMNTVDEEALTAAVMAYDAARCIAHGGDAPMSERNRQTIRPMIAAAIRAYLSENEGSSLLPGQRCRVDGYRDPRPRTDKEGGR